MTPASQNDELLDLLSEAAVEIANLDGPGNVVCRRLRAMQKRLQPLTTTIGELAERADVPPRDMLEAAIAAGVSTFWHAGQALRNPSLLRTYLAMRSYSDPVPELEFDLASDQAVRLAAELGMDVEQIVPAPAVASEAAKSKPIRKFVASESQAPNLATAKRQEQSG